VTRSVASGKLTVPPAASMITLSARSTATREAGSMRW